MRRYATLSFVTLLLAAASCDTSTDVNTSSDTVINSGSTALTKAPSFELPEGRDALAGEQRRAVERLQGTTEYTEEMLQRHTADVEISVYNDNSDEIVLAAWKNKWLDQIEAFSLTGGCGCCVDIYTVTGPKAAIEEFPVSEYRRKYYPQYKHNTGG
jgi:hypothetical protein